MENIINGNLIGTNVIYLEDKENGLKKVFSQLVVEQAIQAATDSNIQARIESLPEVNIEKKNLYF